MHSFRERPLTWLFWIATACLDAVAFTSNYESDLSNALVQGQLLVASGWLVLGHAHRLARAAVFVTAIASFSALDFFAPRFFEQHFRVLVWPHVHGVIMVLAAATTIATACWLWIARLTVADRPGVDRVRWQFPLAELFGWMIIVAVASVGLRVADFSLIVDQRSDVVGSLALVFIVGGLMALSLGQTGHPSRAWHVLTAMLSFATVTLFAESIRKDQIFAMFAPCAYVALWIFVCRLDKWPRHPGGRTPGEDGGAIYTSIRIDP